MSIVDRVSKMAGIRTSNTSDALIRKRADEARDAFRFREAAELYSQFLASNPNSFEIWVQKGNCAKDCGEYRTSRDAYEAAIRLRPDDADVYLQLGHLSKLEGNLVDAGQAYNRSFELKPTVATGFELQKLGFDTEVRGVSAEGKSGTVYFEIDDLLGYVKAHPTLSGIQRVQAGIANYVSHHSTDIEFEPRFVIRDLSYEQFIIRQIDSGKLMKLLDYMGMPSPSHAVMKDIVSDIEDTSLPVQLSRGDVYFITGAFWGYGGVVSNYETLRVKGVRLGVYIYDIIPVTHPEYCDAILSRDFLMSLGDGLAIFDFVLTISEYTASEVRRIIRKYNLRPIPVSAIPLAHSFGLGTGSRARPTLPSATIRDLQGTPYVLYVSTIEGRKNHQLVLSSWQEMLKEGLTPPDLVFVGRHGWRVDALFETLAQTNYLNGRVRILHDLSDVDLQQLYAGCLFTVFTSFVEGWGLPVGESLVAGKPCVASNNSSIPEVGGDFVDYCDPYQTAGATTALFKRMCFDHAYRRDREENIKESFKPRTWQDVGRDFVASVQTYVKSGEQVTSLPPLVKESEFFSPSMTTTATMVGEDYIANPLRLLMNETWYRAETFGSWMRGRKGRLQFSTTLAPGTTVVVYAEIVALAEGESCSVTMTVGEDVPQVHATAGQPLVSRQVVVRRGIVGPDGQVSILFLVSGRLPSLPNDARSFVMGLTSLAYAQADSLQARLSLLESYMFSSARRELLT